MSAARPSMNHDPQDGLFDDVLDNDVLEKALERRQAMKDRQRTANQNFKTADDEAKQHISKLDLKADQVVRCGRFRIKITRRAARAVSFETDESTRTSITLLDN